MPTLIPTKTPYLFVVENAPQFKPSAIEIEKSHLHWLWLNGYFAQPVDEKALSRQGATMNVRHVDSYEKSLAEMDDSTHLVVAIRITSRTVQSDVVKHYLKTADKQGAIIVKRIFLSVDNAVKSMKEVKRLESTLGKREFARRVKQWGLCQRAPRNSDGIIAGERFFVMLNEA